MHHIPGCAGILEKSREPARALFFHRFRPGLTALLLAYILSLLLQFFSYAYWSYGTTRNFSASLSHLDSFYFALGTLTTAGTGNIAATSETARGLQTLQMGLDVVIVGFALALVLARYANLLPRFWPEARPDHAVAKPEKATIQPTPDRSPVAPADDSNGESSGKAKEG